MRRSLRSGAQSVDADVHSGFGVRLQRVYPQRL